MAQEHASIIQTYRCVFISSVIGPFDAQSPIEVPIAKIMRDSEDGHPAPPALIPPMGAPVLRSGASQRRGETFVAGWSFKRITAFWRTRVAEYGADPLAMFVAVNLQSPKPQVRSQMSTWWPSDELQPRIHELKRRVVLFNGHGICADEGDHLAGMSVTAETLWQHRGNPAVIAAILIAGSLWPTVGTCRSGGQWHCENYSDLYQLFHVLSEGLYERDARPPWHHWYTTVLPTAGRLRLPALWRKKLSTMKNVLDDMAKGHAEIIRANLCIGVSISKGHLDSDIVAEIAAEDAHTAEKQRRHAIEWVEARARQAAEDAAYKALHPRCEEWPPSEEVLAREVWQTSAVELGRLYGVSDAMIAKHCKKHGIPKPPRGFWPKVHAGRIPHPNGEPPTDRPAPRRTTSAKAATKAEHPRLSAP
jgi:hypothetical protein